MTGRNASDGQAGDDQGWGPDVEGRARPRRLRRVAAVLVVVVLLVLVAFPLALLAQIPRTDVDGLTGSGSPMHVLVIGSDSREGLSPEEQVELSTGRSDTIGGERTDTIFVMSIDGGDVAMLAFPRDLWVTRCDGSTGRINVAYSLGGETCLADTVRALSGIEIQHTMTVTFGGFREVVDAVDGVQVCLDEAIEDDDAGISLPSGCQRLDGAEALGFVRVRKIDDDLMRIQRQQQFVRALAAQVAQPSTLLNPLRLWRLARESGDAISVDAGFGIFSAARLGFGARGLASGDLVAHTVPSKPHTTDSGAQVLLPVEPDAQSLFAQFRNGSVFARASTEIERRDVRVDVRNAAGIEDLAGRTARALEQRGYGVGEIGNADTRRQMTLVLYPSGLREAAEMVAGDLPGAVEVQADEDVAEVTVVLGSSAGAGA